MFNIGIDYIELILFYTLIKIDEDDKIELEKMLKTHLNPEIGEKFMVSLAQHWEQQGIQKGIQQGIQQGIQIGEIVMAKKMLEKNKPLDEIIEFTGLNRKELEKLQELNEKGKAHS